MYCTTSRIWQRPCKRVADWGFKEIFFLLFLMYIKHWLLHSTEYFQPLTVSSWTYFSYSDLTFSLSFFGSWINPTQLWRSVLNLFTTASTSRTYQTSSNKHKIHKKKMSKEMNYNVWMSWRATDRDGQGLSMSYVAPETCFSTVLKRFGPILGIKIPFISSRGPDSRP